MNIHTSRFLFIGTNSQVLESYRRNLADFSVQVASPDVEISALESFSALFIDVEQLGELSERSEMGRWSDELSKNLSLLPLEVPIIVISALNVGDEASLRALNPRFRVLKKPLQAGELLHETKNVIAQQSYVAQHLQSERLSAIRQVLRGISHELGNIVLRIAGKADLAMMEDDVARTHHHVEGIVDASQKASTLVKNLQAFAKTRPNMTSGKLSQAIEEALSRLESPIEQQKIVVRKKWSFESGEPEIHLDFKAMSQVFFNLFENSVIAMPQGGSLTIEMKFVSARHPTNTATNSANLAKSATEAVKTQEQPGTPRTMEIKISDSGAGMTPDVLKRAFDFAFSTRKDQASGLGLPIAHELVKNQGGELELTTEPERGTEISIWLPVRPC
jgi:signal transduction histidine kinase